MTQFAICINLIDFYLTLHFENIFNLFNYVLGYLRRAEIYVEEKKEE